MTTEVMCSWIWYDRIINGGEWEMLEVIVVAHCKMSSSREQQTSVIFINNTEKSDWTRFSRPSRFVATFTSFLNVCALLHIEPLMLLTYFETLILKCHLQVNEATKIFCLRAPTMTNSLKLWIFVNIQESDWASLKYEKNALRPHTFYRKLWLTFLS
jgi:hypothetical protein